MNTTDQSGQAGSLLCETDPAPFTLINASGGDHALLVGDHAGRAIPAGLERLGLAETDLQRHIAYDLATRELIEIIAGRLNLPALLANYSRLVVDLNRRLDDPTAFIENSDGTDIPGNRDLSAPDKEARVREIYQPYHAAIDQWLNDVQGRQLVPALVSIHSFTPELNGSLRPWQVGVLSDKDRRIAGPLVTALRSYENILVGDNEPYSGKHIADYTIDHHAEAAGLPCAGIEVRQDLLQSDNDREYWAGILVDELGSILADPELHAHMTDPVEPPNGYANP